MEADWNELARMPFPPPKRNTASTPITALAFDYQQELIWLGNEYGRINSFFSLELRLYTSYVGHPGDMYGVRQIVPCEKGILSVSSRTVHFNARNGVPTWHLTDPAFRDLYTVCLPYKTSTEAYAAGCQNTIFKIDIDNGKVIESTPTQEQYTLFKRGGQYICAATTSGHVQLLDPKTLAVLKSWKAHQGWINDMDANASYLITSGWTPRQQYGSTLDPLAKVFDLKSLTPMIPVPFHSGAAFVRLHPRMVTTAVIAGRSGQLQIVDLMNHAAVIIKQVNVMDSILLGLEISQSGEAFAFPDSMCSLQIWGSPTRVHFADFPQPTEFEDEVVPMREKIELDWEGEKPFGLIGMPYYREVLFSAWPSHMIFEVGAPPMQLDHLVQNVRQRPGEIGKWFPNHIGFLPGQVDDTRAMMRESESIEGPRFLSEQAKDVEQEVDQSRRISLVMDAMNAANIGHHSKVEIPVMYRNVEIKYSKFGVEDFDFEYYNKTNWSGLETHIENSYANSLLQLWKYTPWIRNAALIHTASSCLYEHCILCECGFLFDMLEKAAGQNCQATNFLRVFGSLPNSRNLGLLETHPLPRPYTIMVQEANRSLLLKIAEDCRQVSESKSLVDQILMTSVIETKRCSNCDHETANSIVSHHHDLVYPPRTPSKGHGGSRIPSFSQVLKATVERSDMSRTHCNRCQRSHHHNIRKVVQHMPPVLMLNAAIHNSEARGYWGREGWLPQEIGILIDQQGQLFCFEGQALKEHLDRGFGVAVYELMGIVAEINSGEAGKSHLVSMINVLPSLSKDDANTETDYHLFNDFLVRPIHQDEALHFDPAWKLPSVLCYQAKNYRHSIDDSWKSQLDTSILYTPALAQDHTGKSNSETDPSQLRRLSNNEAPQPNTHVGIDAEFVSLQQEELELHPDGTRAVHRPSRLGLARVSVLRGGDVQPRSPSRQPESDGAGITEAPKILAPVIQAASTPDPSLYQPFIDDYVCITEPIADYLTQYSGIHPGDLSPVTSPYTASGRLVSLKAAYKKLWILLNLGCVFVGHGLPKDFRTINMQVPRDQVVDTVDLFFDRRRGGGRKLSLRFLSWLLLGVRVQEEPGEALITTDADGMPAPSSSPSKSNNTLTKSISNTSNPSGGGLNPTDRLTGHDSTVDARMALRLYKVWQDASREGPKAVERLLSEVYRRGREVGFKVPPVGAENGPRFNQHRSQMSEGALGYGPASGRVTPVGGEGEGSAPGTPRARAAVPVVIRAPDK